MPERAISCDPGKVDKNKRNTAWHCKFTPRPNQKSVPLSAPRGAFLLPCDGGRCCSGSVQHAGGVWVGIKESSKAEARGPMQLATQPGNLRSPLQAP